MTMGKRKRHAVLTMVGANLFHVQKEERDRVHARQRDGWPAGITDMPATRKVADAIRHLSGSKPRVADGE
jgi:hypothetical protein